MNAEASLINAVRTSGSGEVRQYLSFFIGAEEYGADIMQIQEIKGWDAVTRVPYTPAYMLGVINLRGSIVPIIDLRVRLGAPSAVFDVATVIVVVHVAAERGQRIVGLVADSVTDVYDVLEDSICPPPEVMASGERRFIEAIANIDGKLVILLDVESLVRSSIEAN